MCPDEEEGRGSITASGPRGCYPVHARHDPEADVLNKRLLQEIRLSLDTFFELGGWEHGVTAEDPDLEKLISLAVGIDDPLATFSADVIPPGSFGCYREEDVDLVAAALLSRASPVDGGG
ncbi:unnamed protein product, partial [Ectocarpus fasciculatus]